MKLSIGMILQHPLEYSLGTTETVLGFAKALARQGTIVHIFSPLEKTRKICDGVYLHHVGTKFSSKRLYRIARFIYSHPALARKLILSNRVIKRLSDQLSSEILKYIRINGIKLNIIQGEQEIPSLAAIKISQQLGIPCVSHFHNVWAEEAVDIGLATENDLILKSLTKQIVSQASLIVTPTPYMLEYFERNYSPRRVVYVPRGVTLMEERKYYSYPPYRVIYSGTLAVHENIDLYLEAAKIICQEKPEFNVEFYITGKGDDASKLKKLSRKLGLPMNFLWFPTKEEYYRFLLTCHIGIIPWNNKVSRRLGFPMKLLDYAAAGMAIIATNIGGWTGLIEKEEMGVLVEPNPRDMAHGISYLLTNPCQIIGQGQKARKFAEKYTWNEASKILLKEYMRLLS